MTYIPPDIREQVRHRAKERCEYCLKPEKFGLYSFQIDHIIAQKHDGTSELDNLAWACFKCNNTKGTDIASYDHETGELTPFYNPRKDIWNEHFQYEGAELNGTTSIGRVTIRLLQLNYPKHIAFRRILMENGLW